MGYRSEVIIGIPKEKAQQFIDLKMEAPLSPVLEILEQVKTVGGLNALNPVFELGKGPSPIPGPTTRSDIESKKFRRRSNGKIIPAWDPGRFGKLV